MATGKPIEPCPVTASRVRQLRAAAVIASDDRGPTRYAADSPQKMAEAAQGHVSAGPVTWQYETRNGAIVSWPAFAKAQPEPTADATWHLVERMSELIARVHRDAYRQANEMLAETLAAQQSVMATLANRTIYLEERAADLESRAAAADAAGVDDLATKVIDHAFAQAATAGQAKGKPNGRQ